MGPRSRLKDSATTLRVGLSFLILASLSRWFLHPSARLSENVVDAAKGFLYGVAIACMLLSLVLGRRKGSGTDLGPRA
jgi:hypothetical protein